MIRSRLLLLALLSTVVVGLGGCIQNVGGRGESGDDDDSAAAPDDDDDTADDDDTIPPGDDDDTVPPGDDDDTIPPGDDDDTVPPGDDDDDSTSSGPGPLPATSDVACGGGNGSADIYLLTLSGAVQVTVDTTSAATTFDPYAYVTTDIVGFTTTGVLEVGDDELPCSFPPPTYACPQFETTHTGPVALVIYGYIGECNGSGVGNYEVSVTGAGAPATYDGLLDDYAL